MSYSTHCQFCKKIFTTARIHKVFCGTGCRVKSHRLLKDHKLIAELVPEDIAMAKYWEWQSPHTPSNLILRWFRCKFPDGISRRFADVYVNKDFKLEDKQYWGGSAGEQPSRHDPIAKRKVK